VSLKVIERGVAQGDRKRSHFTGLFSRTRSEFSRCWQEEEPLKALAERGTSQGVGRKRNLSRRWQKEEPLKAIEICLDRKILIERGTAK